MIFFIKMDGRFTRKNLYVAGSHTTDPPSPITYSIVVSRDSIRIAFTIADLKDVEINAADIDTEYLNAKCREKIWTVAGTEYGGEKGKVMLVVHALYGLKSSGAAWRQILAQTLRDLGYVSYKADPEVWLKSKPKPDGTEYYAYVLVYVDDILHLHHDPDTFMNRLAEVYMLKDGSGREPGIYLRAKIEKVQLDDGSVEWSMKSREYITNAIQNLEYTLACDGAQPLNIFVKKSGERPFPSNYRPKLEVSPVSDNTLMSRYLQLIGVLRWSIEFIRINIMEEVSILSQHQCQPR